MSATYQRMAPVKRVKVAMIRTDVGSLVLNCRCGAFPSTEVDPSGFDGPDVTCRCGKVYTFNGYVLEG